LPGTGPLAARWLGTGVLERVVVAVWRILPWMSVWLVTQPVVRVGRRPYRIGRLAERLEAIRDMEITPNWLPDGLRWLRALVIVTAITAAFWPLRLRRWHAVVAAAALAAALATHRSADTASITSPTWQLAAIAVATGAVVLAALAPTRLGGPRRGA
jgi:hypothetical protein